MLRKTLSRTASEAPGLQSVNRTPYARAPAVQDMSIDHGRPKVGVAEELLNRADVRAALEQMGREGVAQRVTRCPLREPGGANGDRERALQGGAVQVMPSSDLCFGFYIRAAGGEYPLPRPLDVAIRKLPPERPWQHRSAKAGPPIPLELLVDSLKMLAQRGRHSHRQGNAPVLATLAAADHDLVPGEIDILDTQGEAFGETQAAPVQERHAEA